MRLSEKVYIVLYVKGRIFFSKLMLVFGVDNC